MCQQEGIGDDDQHDQFDSGDDQEEVDRAGEVYYHHQEVLDEEEDGDKRAGSITDTYSLTVRLAAPGCRAQHFGEGAPDRWSPSLNPLTLFPDGNEALMTWVQKLTGSALWLYGRRRSAPASTSGHCPAEALGSGRAACD
jgi:hypothetical protein